MASNRRTCAPSCVLLSRFGLLQPWRVPGESVKAHRSGRGVQDRRRSRVIRLTSSMSRDSSMTDPFDAWTTATKIEPPAHVHAFGMIAMNTAMMEEVLTLLLAYFLRLSHEISIPLIHKISVRDRSDLIRHIASERENELCDLWPHIDFALKCFNTCIENRNILIHSVYVNVDKVTQTMTVSKRSKNNPAKEFKLDLPLPKLRKTAEEIANTVNYLLDLWFVLTHGPGTNTLLRKPPLPTSLNPPAVPKAPKTA